MEKDRSLRYGAMADLERDLERLLAGDQNVGLPLADPSKLGKPAAAPPRRWHLGLVAVAALVGGVALALARPPGKVHTQSPAAPTAPPAVVAPPPAPAAAAAATETRPAAAEAATPERAAKPTAVRARPRGERRAPAAPASKTKPATSDSERRGVLPSGSREAYPDQ
jgi:hypothetical protein